jgi:hypothetical protein
MERPQRTWPRRASDQCWGRPEALALDNETAEGEDYIDLLGVDRSHQR